jgi:NADPH:quinone reductase-like Zn-dependent oxidoreductase
MKAVVYERYGPPEVLQINEVARPTPKNSEVLVKVHAVTVTTYDCWVRSCTAPTGFWLPMRIASGIRRPKQPVLGTDLSGDVEAVGEGITRFKPGDQVVGYLGMNLGAHAEYVCLPEEAVAPKPANATYEESASVLQGALTALYFLKKGNIQPGQQVLIYGASGGVGAYAVQLASHFGAHVTGVCSTGKMDWVKSLGASEVIDYTREDFTKNGQTYDIIFDTVGKTSVSRSRRALKRSGVYLFATFGLPLLVQIMWFSLTTGLKTESGILKERNEDLLYLMGLMEAGKLKATIDRSYPMEQIVEAHRYVETGSKKGNVVVTFEH